VFQVPDVEAAVVRAGLEFSPVGLKEYPLGTLRKLDEQLGHSCGLRGLIYSIKRGVQQVDMFLREAPEVVSAAGVDALVIDGVEVHGGSIAEHLSLSYVQVSLALPVIQDEFVPPYFTGWSYRPDLIGRLRNRAGYRFFFHAARPLLDRIASQRSRWGLPSLQDRQSRRARLAEVTQLPACLDFPRVALARFYYTGPFGLGAVRPEVSFPWQALDGRPLVYAALGTVMPQPGILRIIARACAGLDIQVVLSLGGGSTKPESLGPLPNNVIVVSYAPQLEILKRATMVITHGGLNTVLESLSYGVPMVIIPFNNDQPGVAARVAWRGAGEVVSPRYINSRRIRSAIQRVLSHPAYRQSAQWLQSEIVAADGLRRASDLIERSLTQ
jgi:UDP:flavonoid glycosyltransferase YjiC (YdhE family)